MNPTIPIPLQGSSPATILVVDDTPENLTVLAELLQANYRVRIANSGARALHIAATPPRPDLILLDVMMPGMDGFEVLHRLRANPATRSTPVVFVTALDSSEDEERGLDAGAADYITKPIKPAVVMARVRMQLELKRAREFLQDHNAFLEAEVQRRLADYSLAQDISIHAMARLAETRDPETGNHLLRTQEYVRSLALQLSGHERFSHFLTPRNIELLPKSALLHDIGKVGIPDHVLLKAGRLSDDEWLIMKTHAQLGSEAIEQAERDAKRPVEFLALAKDIAHYHHERWDGSGYPAGLSGAAIPISARLMALADVFDALISKRVYKKPIVLEQAREMVVQGRGSHFDPDVVDAFVAAFASFAATAQRYADAEI